MIEEQAGGGVSDGGPAQPIPLEGEGARRAISVKEISDIAVNSLDPKAVIEALLFVSEKPLLIDQIKNVLSGLETVKIRDILMELKADYQQGTRGLRIEEIAGGFQIATSKEVASALKKFYKLRDAQRLSAPALETLAIIAYKQPVTRLDIESLRGVNVDGVIKSLTDKSLIRIAGRKDIIGRPFVYATTRQFLEYFGLASLGELPKMEDFTNLPQSGVMPLVLSNRQDLGPLPDAKETDAVTEKEQPQNAGG